MIIRLLLLWQNEVSKGFDALEELLRKGDFLDDGMLFVIADLDSVELGEGDHILSFRYELNVRL